MGTRHLEQERVRFAAAMLRVVLALRREPDIDLEETITRVIDETGVEATTFRQYIGNHVELMTRAIDP